MFGSSIAAIAVEEMSLIEVSFTTVVAKLMFRSLLFKRWFVGLSHDCE